jgi:DNA modification methylase
MNLRNQILQGHVIEKLKEIPERFVNMCVTSPPYWGLRNYGTIPQLWGGDPACQHDWTEGIKKGISGGHNSPVQQLVKSPVNYQESPDAQFSVCGKCGCWRGELGQEPDPNLFIEHLCLVFDEVWRVLADNGTLWVNLDDTYSGSGGSGGDYNPEGIREGQPIWHAPSKPVRSKSLVGIPARFQIAMIQRGWICRNDLIWHKPNPMPESCTDRFTNDYEHFFLFAKQEHYYFEQQLEEATAIHYSTNSKKGGVQAVNNSRAHGKTKALLEEYKGQGKKEYAENGVQNPSDVKRRILAGQEQQLQRQRTRKTGEGVDSEVGTKGCCGSPHVVTYHDKQADELGEQPSSGLRQKQKPQYLLQRNMRSVWSIPTQPHPEAHFATFPEKLIETPIKAGCPINGIVLDPFFGSGMTGKVSNRLARDFVGIELNPDYCKIAETKTEVMAKTKRLDGFI